MIQQILVTTIEQPLSCRLGCAACCIAPSISSPIPNMPLGKPAGVRCVQLPSRPKVCGSLQPSLSMCGQNTQQAMAYLSELEQLTS